MKESSNTKVPYNDIKFHCILKLQKKKFHCTQYYNVTNAVGLEVVDDQIQYALCRFDSRWPHKRYHAVEPF